MIRDDEDLHWMLVSFAAMSATSARLGPNHPPVIMGEVMTDDDRREGIREYFSDEAPDDETVELALVHFKTWEAEQEALRNITDMFTSIVPSMWSRG